ncbi:DUF3854 domain-containing protein, partial [Anabaena azotica FACHB-119]|nr:DUF3854 domain-containing protein [Anabaena azotica FACHB-119]
MSPDGKGGWKWEKYDPKSNEYISTTATETLEVASTVADSITQGITDAKQYQLVDPQIIAETKQANLLSSTQGLKVETDDQTVVVHQGNTGTFGFSMIDENNQIIRDSSFFQEFQSDLNQYLAECLDTFKNNPDIIKNNAECLKDILTSSLSPQDSPKQTSTIEEVNEEINPEVNPEVNPEINLELNSEVNPEINPHFEEKLQGDIKEVVAEDSSISPSQQKSQSQGSVIAPSHIDDKHWQELVEKSAIAPGIAAMNFQSLHFSQGEGSHEAWEKLMISDQLPRTNTGRLSGGIMKVYSFLDNTDGWWCSAGVDPRQFEKMNTGEIAENKEWGCYKPDSPRPKTEKKDGVTVVVPGKFTKYEHPPGVEKSIFLLDVPEDIAQGIYQKAGVNPNESDRASGFWYCVWKHNVPITITEGAKKTASLLSQGYAAIGLAGINGGYYKTKKSEKPIDNEVNTDLSEDDARSFVIEDEVESSDEEIEFHNTQGKQTHYLHPELAVFATRDRDFKICFDFETKSETVRNVNAATRCTGQLLETNGCKVSVISLPGPDKGVDDFIVNRGSAAFEQLQSLALPLHQWDEQLYLASRQRDERLYLDQDLRSTIKFKDGTTKVVQHQPRNKVEVPTPRDKSTVNNSPAVATELKITPTTPPAAVGSQPSPLENTTQSQRAQHNGTATVSGQQSSSANQTNANPPKIAPTENQSSDNVTVQTPPDQSTREKEATQAPPKQTNVNNVAVPTPANKSTVNNEPAIATELKITPTNLKIETLSTAEFSQPKQQSNNTQTPGEQREQQSPPNTTSVKPQPTATNTQEESPPKEPLKDTDTPGWFSWLRKPKIETPPSPTPNWTKTQDVTLYQRNWRRRQLEAKENQAIAAAAVALVKKYGVANDNQVTYVADAFVVNKKGENYTISRR